MNERGQKLPNFLTSSPWEKVWSTCLACEAHYGALGGNLSAVSNRANYRSEAAQLIYKLPEITFVKNFARSEIFRQKRLHKVQGIHSLQRRVSIYINKSDPKTYEVGENVPCLTWHKNDKECVQKWSEVEISTLYCITNPPHRKDPSETVRPAWFTLFVLRQSPSNVTICLRSVMFKLSRMVWLRDLLGFLITHKVGLLIPASLQQMAKTPSAVFCAKYVFAIQ